MAGKKIIVWIILMWAIISGCFVTDLWVCPWTAVFEPYATGKDTEK